MDETVRDKILTISAVACSIGGVILICIHVSYHPHLWTPLLIGVPAALSFAATPILQRMPRFRTQAGNVFVGALSIGIIVPLMGVGGIAAELAPAIVVLPVVAAFFGGWRTAVIVATACALTIGLCWGLDEVGLMSHAAVLAGLPGIRVAAIVDLIVTCIVALIAIASAELYRRAYANALAAREDAERANAAKAEFLAIMSHEIRTPLNGMVSLVETLALSEADKGRRGTLDVIDQSARQLQSLLSDILDFSRMESGKLTLEEGSFLPDELVRRSILLFGTAAEVKGLQLICDLDPSCQRAIVGDPLRISQILNNLLSNAIKFSDQGSITVTGLVDGDGASRTLVLTVADQGPGIPEDVQRRLFQRFEQGDSATTRRHSGAGLGLAISQMLARQMGGALTVRSTPGEGAQFTCRLELAAPEAGLSGPVETDQPSVMISMSDLEHLWVLVVDDHEVNRLVARTVLGSMVGIVEAADGAQAVNAMRAQSFDLILMDMQMPVMDGLEAIVRIRALEAEQGRLPSLIAMVSANAFDEHKAAAIAAGADEHVAKPFRVETLMQLAARAAARRGATAERMAG